MAEAGNAEWTVQIAGSAIIITGPNVSFALTKEHPSYNEVMDAIRDNRFDDIAEIMDVRARVVRESFGELVVEDNQILYKGEPVHNFVCGRILEHMQAGRPYKGLLKFLERLMSNPHDHVKETLFKFLENQGMPIDDEGYFYGYKGVAEDYYDIHSHTIDNTPDYGKEVSLPKEQVDSNPQLGCSKGLHVGAYEYAANYANTNGKLIVVRVDPADVASVPADHAWQKLRTTRYWLVEECFRGKSENVLKGSPKEHKW